MGVSGLSPRRPGPRAAMSTAAATNPTTVMTNDRMEPPSSAARPVQPPGQGNSRHGRIAAIAAPDGCNVSFGPQRAALIETAPPTPTPPPDQAPQATRDGAGTQTPSQVRKPPSRFQRENVRTGNDQDDCTFTEH